MFEDVHKLGHVPLACTTFPCYAFKVIRVRTLASHVIGALSVDIFKYGTKIQSRTGSSELKYFLQTPTLFMVTDVSYATNTKPKAHVLYSEHGLLSLDWG